MSPNQLTTMRKVALFDSIKRKKTGLFMKVSLMNQDLKKGEEFKIGVTGHFTKGTGEMVKQVDEVGLLMQKTMFTLASGWMMRPMVMEFTFMF